MRNILKVVLILLFLIVIVIPYFLINGGLDFSNGSNTLFTIHRILGLYAFSLIFIQIVLGSSMTILGKVFPLFKIRNFHMSLGKIAFLVALLHPILLYSTYLTEHNLSYVDAFTEGDNALYFNLGLTAYFLLIISVLSALLRDKIGKYWIYFHRLNYLIFWLVFFHSFHLGVDTHSDLAQNLYIIYGVIAALLSSRKIISIFLKFRQQKTLAPENGKA